MNGVTDGYMQWMHADDEDNQRHDEEAGAWFETTVICPFCNRKVDWKFDRYHCGDCAVNWPTRADVERDRNQPEPGDDDRDRPNDSKWGLFR